MTTADSGYVPQGVDDELDTDVLPIRRRPRLSPLTAALALGAVAAAAFIGGVEIQKHSGSSASAAGSGGAGFAAARGGAASGTSASGRRFGRGSSGAAGGFPAGLAGGANATVGLVTLIKGTTLYVTDFSGNTVKVKTTKGLRVSKTVTTTLKGVHPGDSVVVRGTKQKDGSYRASSVSIGDGAATGGSGSFAGAGSNG